MESVLHRHAMPFVEMVDSLSLESLSTRYSFTDNEDFLELAPRDVCEGMRLYWTEILARAHIAAATSILRSGHWTAAMLSTHSEGNALGFAAASRALMESAVDTSSSLLATPLALADLYAEISEALSGRATTVVTSTELESHLIHYSHARYLKRSEKASMPPTHQALRPSELKDLKAMGNPEKVAAAYRFLSDLTHSGAASVSLWLAPVDATGLEFTLSSKQGGAVIAGFLEAYETVLLDTLMLAFNTPVVVLNTLNYFPVKEFHTPSTLERRPSWSRRLEKVLE